jgi:hypothetical protein
MLHVSQLNLIDFKRFPFCRGSSAQHETRHGQSDDWRFAKGGNRSPRPREAAEDARPEKPLTAHSPEECAVCALAHVCRVRKEASLF